MKIKLTVFLITVFAFACQNAPKETETKTETTTEKVAIANVQLVELNIEGMTCTGCENAIQKTINEFEGVYSSKADHTNGIAKIQIDSTKVDVLKIEEAINDLGYVAKGHTITSE